MGNQFSIVSRQWVSIWVCRIHLRTLHQTHTKHRRFKYSNRFLVSSPISISLLTCAACVMWDHQTNGHNTFKNLHKHIIQWTIWFCLFWFSELSIRFLWLTTGSMLKLQMRMRHHFNTPPPMQISLAPEIGRSFSVFRHYSAYNRGAWHIAFLQLTSIDRAFLVQYSPNWLDRDETMLWM